MRPIFFFIDSALYENFNVDLMPVMGGARLFLAVSLLFTIGAPLALGGDSAVASRTEEDEAMMELSRAWRVYSWYVLSRSQN
jgi:hypothetical protein